MGNEVTLEKLLNLVKSYNPDEVDKIRKAYEMADNFHYGQRRNSGEPYIIHPLNVAYILAELHADGNTICAGLLHDTREDTEATWEEIVAEFNEEVATLVEGVTKISGYASDRSLINTRKIIMGITTDVRIIIIKLADRLHNMRTLQFKRPEKQKKIALETLEIFVPLANYLGVYRMKSELEDLSFFYLKPDSYKKVSEDVQVFQEQNKAMLEKVLADIRSLLINEGIPVEIKARVKNIYGVYKQLEQNHQLKDIHDLLALRVMVDEVKQCYYALMVIHSLYRPFNGQIKDYIFNPKTNLYRSLHTTIFGPNDQLIQTRIRTHEMDRIGSYGFPAYWDIYKGEARHKMQKLLTDKFQFFKSLTELDEMFIDNAEFVEQVKKELFTENIHVYTPKGEVIELPLGATIIDFAYRIHTHIGDQMTCAIVNDTQVDLNYKLKNNDRVRIVTSTLAEGPNESWLDIAITASAKRKIREFIAKNSQVLTFEKKG